MERVICSIDLDRLRPSESVLSWASTLGAREEDIVRLSGGINNDVYRVDTDRRSYVLKYYPALESKTRDRMKAEVEFLQYANVVAPTFIPRLLDFDVAARTVLLEFIEGKPFSEDESLSEVQIRDAVCFFQTLNKDRDTAHASISMDAAEGFFKLSDHLANVHQRISQLSTNHLPKAAHHKSLSLISLINHQYTNVKENALNAIKRGDVVDAIEPDERCISPSDFGFHNALQTTTGIRFIDFEFAGWDDPAKASLDFVMQPRVQIFAQHTILSETIPKQRHEKNEKRTNLLGAILRIKWLCIILAILNHTRFSELIKNMVPLDVENLINKQLQIASKYFKREFKFWPTLIS